MKNYLLALCAVLCQLLVFGQGEAASGSSWLVQDRKIFVAVVVLGIVLACIFVFLFYMEKQLKRLEANQKR